MFARTQRLMLRPQFTEDVPAVAAVLTDSGTVIYSAALCNMAGDAAGGLHIGVIADDEMPACASGVADDPSLPCCLIFRRTQAAPVLIGGIGLSRDAAGVLMLRCWMRADADARDHAAEAADAMRGIAGALGLTAPPAYLTNVAATDGGARIVPAISIVEAREACRNMSHIAANAKQCDCDVLAARGYAQ